MFAADSEKGPKHLNFQYIRVIKYRKKNIKICQEKVAKRKEMLFTDNI